MNDLSVVIPLYEAGPWVRDAIASVLERADGLREIVVVDDGSTDDGPEIARSFGDPVRVLSQANAGPAAARNAGIAAATGAPEPVAAGEALRRVLASTLQQMPGRRAASVAALSALARALPAYELAVGPDLDTAVARIGALA